MLNPTAEYYVAGQNHIWGVGDTPEEAIEDAEEWLTDGGEEMPEIGTHPSDNAEFNLARHGEPLDDADLADGNWHLVPASPKGDVGFEIEALE